MPTSTLVLVKNKTTNCAYVIFHLNTIPQKIPLLFLRPKKIPASFIDPKKSLLAKMSDPKNPSDPPVIEICEWGPWGGPLFPGSATEWFFTLTYISSSGLNGTLNGTLISQRNYSRRRVFSFRKFFIMSYGF